MSSTVWLVMHKQQVLSVAFWTKAEADRFIDRRYCGAATALEVEVGEHNAFAARGPAWRVEFRDGRASMVRREDVDLGAEIPTMLGELGDHLVIVVVEAQDVVAAIPAAKGVLLGMDESS